MLSLFIAPNRLRFEVIRKLNPISCYANGLYDCVYLHVCLSMFCYFLYYAFLMSLIAKQHARAVLFYWDCNFFVFQPPPSLKPFDPDEFIETVQNNGPQLTSMTKGDWIGLYQRFLFSANFEYWLRKRRREMKGKVWSLHLIALSETVRVCSCEDGKLPGFCASKLGVKPVF